MCSTVCECMSVCLCGCMLVRCDCECACALYVCWVMYITGVGQTNGNILTNFPKNTFLFRCILPFEASTALILLGIDSYKF